MRILALDTSGTSASAALMDEYIILAESSVTLANLRGLGHKNTVSCCLNPHFKQNEMRAKTHSETLMPMVNSIFEITGMTLSDADYIACTCGPGSFTGLRIGAATAKGLAFAAQKPLIAVPTLDAMAYTVTNLAVPGTWVIPMMDARREQAYSAFYHVSEDLLVHRTTDYLADTVHDLLGILKGQISKGCHIIFLGDGASVNQDRIRSEAWPAGITVGFAPPCHNRPQAACVGAQALNIIKNKYPVSTDESEFSLLYIRKPQAQREREAKQKCSV